MLLPLIYKGLKTVEKRREKIICNGEIIWNSGKEAEYKGTDHFIARKFFV